MKLYPRVNKESLTRGSFSIRFGANMASFMSFRFCALVRVSLLLFRLELKIVQSFLINYKCLVKNHCTVNKKQTIIGYEQKKILMQFQNQKVKNKIKIIPE